MCVNIYRHSCVNWLVEIQMQTVLDREAISYWSEHLPSMFQSGPQSRHVHIDYLSSISDM